MSGRHLLVTNDFPPKIGGIQSYLWELWRRLPVGDFAIYTTPYPGAAAFDAQHEMRIERSPEPVIGPYPWLVNRLNRYAEEEGAALVLLDPAIPLGAIGPHLDRPYGVILHGAEVTIPGRLPLSRSILARTLRSASLVIAAGHYPLAEAERCAGQRLPSVVIPPGVDHHRFHPFDAAARAAARRRFGLSDDDFVVATVNRLVPRKGIKTLIKAAARVQEQADPSAGIKVMVGGSGRQEAKLAKLVAETGAPVELLGRLSDEDVVGLYGAADAMAMLCRDRWGGLEQEGFGIVFLEAAAAGLPQIAGRSGGAHEAVEHGVTGLVVDEPRSVEATAKALQDLRRDRSCRQQMGQAARQRAVESFDYDRLAHSLGQAIKGVIDGPE
jgi:phosphatidylinositol alpha-1,6-mannosyltransferase